jgi:hypothetical protein
MITKDVTETTNIERTYWYNINGKGVVPITNERSKNRSES